MTRDLFRIGNTLASLFVVTFMFISSGQAAESTWQAGFSRVIITPDEPMWLSGYAGRTAPSEGKVHDLYARAAALRDPAGKTVVMVSTDLIGVPAKMAKVVSDAVIANHGLSRADLMFTCSHTHCGPALDDALTHIYFLNAEERAKVDRYQQQLNGKLIKLIGEAIAALEPAQLSTGIGHTEFAVNRRPPIGQGPIDHDVPVLRVMSADGKTVRGILFGYACHNTTLSFQLFCGDYAGFAALYLEDRHPDAVALFFLGCGADQNPLPRRTLELCEKYGRMLAVAVDEVMAGKMQPVEGRLTTAFRTVDLDYAHVPTQAELEKQATSNNKYEKALAQRLLDQLAADKPLDSKYPYPVQVWKCGDHVTWVALGGEIVVDYSLRLKEELGKGRTWVTGYANDVMAYIPSERVLKEGGYEGATSMVYYQIPSKWAAGLEDRIIETVKQLTAAVNDSGR